MVFGRSGNLKTYTEKEWLKEFQKRNLYKQLKRTIGSTHAKNTIKSIYTMLGSPKTLSHPRDDKIKWWASWDKMIQSEMNRVVSCSYHILNLSVRAQGAALGQALHAKPPLAPNAYGAQATDTELMKAANWIVNSSNSLRAARDDANAPVNLTKVHAALQHVVQNMDVKTWAAIKYLHVHTVDQTSLKASRGPAADPTVKYCCTGGAAYLLERAFSVFSGLPTPPNNDPLWDSLACFAIGSVIRSHGFTDGNGRAARALYACVLIQGGRNFVPIASDVEKTLHGL